MKIRAVIFDVYNTLLEVAPPPSDAGLRWEMLWHELFGVCARLSLAEFGSDCERAIAREHASAKAAGIPHPEVFWPDIVAEVVPEMAGLAERGRAEFVYRQIGLTRVVRLESHVAMVLRGLQRGGRACGIASNAQAYTLRELDEALAGADISAALFSQELCFWSFAHGFSKPDPHVFRLLTARLRARGVRPHETLMVGDRVDNDIEPARAQGWQTWQITAPTAASWALLANWLEERR